MIFNKKPLLMSTENLSFSNKTRNKNKNKKRELRNDLIVLGTGLTAIKGYKAAVPRLNGKITSKMTSQDHRLNDKLIPAMAKNKIAVVHNPNAMAIKAKHLRSYGNLDKDKYQKLESSFMKKGVSPIALYDAIRKSKNHDNIVLIPNSGKQSTQHVLAHELGHTQGGAVQNLRYVGNVTHAVAIPYAAYGLYGGYHTERGKLTGKKVNAFRKAQGLMIPTANMALNLAGETQASVRGYKALKSLGATEQELSRAKKDLTRAGSTYLVATAFPIALGLGSRYIGKKLAQHDFKKDLKKLHPDWTDAQLNAEVKRLRSKKSIKK